MSEPGRLAGKTAVVTGSTRGIGLAIARAFIREGARVVVNSRNAADCEAVARGLGPSALALAADLARSDDVRRLAREAGAALGGGLDVLVNNAGQPRVAPSEELPEADYRDTLDLNLNGYFVLSQDVARGMLARGSGTIINISSIFGLVAVPQRLAYWGVRVNAVAPGYVETEFIGGLIARGLLDPTKLVRRTPMGRLGSSDEIAEAALFLATPGASFITGEILTVDGGWSSYGFL